MNETCAADGMRKMEKNAENGGPISQFRQEVEVCRTASLNHTQPISKARFPTFSLAKYYEITSAIFLLICMTGGARDQGRILPHALSEERQLQTVCCHQVANVSGIPNRRGQWLRELKPCSRNL